MLSACGAASAPTPTDRAPRSAVVGDVPSAAPIVPADPLSEQLNLSFERGDHAIDGWWTRGDGYEVGPAQFAARSGKRGLRLASPTPNPSSSGVAGSILPIERARGRTIHLGGWIHTTGVTGFAALWLRADGADQGEVLGFDNMHDRAPKGTTEWTHYEVSIAVPIDARAVVFGALLVGTGEAWVDDLAFSFDAPTQPRPSADTVVPWVKQKAARLNTVEAGQGLDDLSPLSAMVSGARVVGLGEATHGTREFFQLKHRMLEYLVEKEGFRVFAIEANLTEARRVNDYVLHGKGTAAEALAGLYFWTWNTEEVLAMIEWLRRYNLEPKHKQPVQFLGIDMQTTNVAWPNVARYLKSVDSVYAKTLPVELGMITGATGAPAWAALSRDERKARRAALDAVVARLDAERASYTRKSSTQAWRSAREDARLVAQAATMLEATGSERFRSRDEAMAENLAWILAQEAKGTKVVLWAHNAHIAKSSPIVNLGQRLASEHGRQYVAFGFVFAEGAFQAVDMTKGARGLREFSLGPAPEADVSTAFSRAGCELCIVDLRKAPTGEVADWFAAPHPMRETGSVFSSEEAMTSPVRLAQRFDAIVFVRVTTRARPNPTAPAAN